MGRPKKEMPEDMKAAIAQDIEAGKTRGDICKERGVTYTLLQKTFGFTCRKPRKQAESVAEPVN